MFRALQDLARRKGVAAESKNGLRSIFDTIDRDHDQHITLAELFNAVRESFGIPPSDVSDRAVDDLFRACDKNDNGTIEIDELAAFVANPIAATSASPANPTAASSASPVSPAGMSPRTSARASVLVDQPTAELAAPRPTLLFGAAPAAAASDGVPDWMAPPQSPRPGGARPALAQPQVDLVLPLHEALNKYAEQTRSKGTTDKYPYQRAGSIFYTMDRDHDSHLTLAELFNAVRETFGIPPSQVSDESIEEFFYKYDTNDNGTIEIDELAAFVNTPARELTSASPARAVSPGGSSAIPAPLNSGYGSGRSPQSASSRGRAGRSLA